MAKLAKEEADDDELEQLADDIIAAQPREIDITEKYAMREHG